MGSGLKSVGYGAQPVIKVPEFKIDTVASNYILTIGDRLLQIIRTFFGIADNSTEQLIKNRINDCKSYLQSNQIDDAIKNLFNVYELLNGKSYFSGLGTKNKISLKFNLDDNSVSLVARNDDNKVNEILTITASDRYCFCKLLEASAKYLNAYALNDQYLENNSHLPYYKCDHYSRLRLLAWRLLYNQSCENMNEADHSITCRLTQRGIFLFDNSCNKRLQIFDDPQSISVIGDSFKGCAEFIMHQLHDQVNSSSIKGGYSKLDNIFNKQDCGHSIVADLKRLTYSEQFITNFDEQLNSDNKNCLNFLTQKTFSVYMLILNQLTTQLYNVIFSINDNFILNNYKEENQKVELEIIGKVSITSLDIRGFQAENIFPIKITYYFTYDKDSIYQEDIKMNTDSLDKINLDSVNYNKVANKNFKSKVQEYILTIIP